MIDLIGLHRANDTNVIRNLLSMGQNVRNLLAAFPTP